jgi:hypothetical protein
MAIFAGKAVGKTRITVKMLHNTLNGFPAEARVNGVTESFMLALALLKYFFGEAWVNEHVTPDTARPNYLRIDESTAENRDLSAVRIIDLGEVIFNLQEVEGFDDCIARMGAGDIEGTFGELDLGRMLFLNEVPFRFVRPSGVKGADFDAEFAYPDGVVGCADAKCKMDTTPLGSKTIINTLRAARKQLPEDRPGAVFVKVPPHWMNDPQFANICAAAARDFLRNTRRVVSVKFYVAPLTFENGFLKQEHAYREISNPVTNFGNDKNWNIFRQHDLPPEANGMPAHWQRILFFPDGKVR